MQGFGLAVFRQQLTAGSVHDALLRVLTDGSFAAAAKRISKQIRSTKRTALQEAVGEGATACHGLLLLMAKHLEEETLHLLCIGYEIIC